jgi:hypothetical protein
MGSFLKPYHNFLLIQLDGGGCVDEIPEDVI